MKIKTVVLVIAALALGGCSSSPEELKAAFEVCEPNGGLERYNVNHAAVCKNGAYFLNPLAVKRG